MRIDFEGRVRELDTARIMFKDAMGIQSYTGMSIGDWQDSLPFPRDDQGNVLNPPPEWLKSVAALYWLMLRQNGETAVIGDTDFDPFGFYAAYVQGVAGLVAQLRAEREAAAAAGPTQPPPSPPGGPPSPAPATPTATTRTPPVPRPPGQAATGS